MRAYEDTDEVRLEVDDGIATITLNRPSKLNCASLGLLQQLTAYLYRIEGRDDVNAVIITGAGSGFCSGFDLSEVPLDEGQQAVHEHFRITALYWHTMIPAIVRLPRPVIAAVNGVAAGGGLGITVACDMAFAAPGATFTPAFFPRGFGPGPDSGTSYHLPKIVGLRKAIEWMYTDETIDAETAADWDVVNRVIREGDLVAETRAVAEQLAENPNVMHAWTKRNMHQSYYSEIETQTEWEQQAVMDSVYTDQFWEMLGAFLEEGESATPVEMPPR